MREEWRAMKTIVMRIIMIKVINIDFFKNPIIII